MRVISIILAYLAIGYLVFLLMLKLQKKGVNFDIEKSDFNVPYTVTLIGWPFIIVFVILPRYLKYKYFK
jgi:hypothetical protein